MIYFLLFINIFSIYIYTMFPTIAAYRDAGEFATVAYVLGVAHPPGYPLYCLISYIFGKILPFSNFAYRINIVSILFSTISSILICLNFNLLNKIYNFLKKNVLLIGYFLSLLFSFGYLQWYLSLVSEMYTLGTFFATLCIFLCSLYYFYNEQFIYLLFYLFALGITNRLEFVLFSPLLLFAGIDYLSKSKRKILNFIILVSLIFIGLSCYFYLPIRSSKKPLINWNNPANIERFLASITRRTHGATLDLISLGYKKGENFFDGFKFYLQHLLRNISILGLIFVIFGIKESFNVHLFYAISLLTSWFFSCIYFIYKANMPPNPHSFAVLEAHFLLPNTIVFSWLFFGIFYFLKLSKKNIKLAVYFFLIFLSICSLKNLYFNFQKLNKRNNFYAYDYTINLLRTLPENSIILIKEDVQLFSVWYRKYVEKEFKKRYVISCGLSGSEWYHEMLYNYFERQKEKKIYVGNIYDNMELKNFINKNSSLGLKIFSTYDVDLYNILILPYGILKIFDKEVLDFKIFDFFYDIYIFRDKYIYDLNWDFFSSDLIEDYSKALLNNANFLIKNKIFELSEQLYKFSIYMSPFIPFSYFELGYLYFLKNDYIKAEFWYLCAIEKFENYLSLAYKYKAQKDVIESTKKQFATSLLHLGVVYEKLNKLENAINYYELATKYDPFLSDAYYNIAVVYWKLREWEKVRFYLKKTLEVNPNHILAVYYINKIPNSK